jgi:acetoacetate decarboxylase
VKTREEIEQIQRSYVRPHYLGMRSLTVHFETTHEAVRQILPPPLEPAAAPVGIAWVSEVGNSSCVGPFSVASVAVRARWRDVLGNYCVTVPVSTPEAVIHGREVFGEPRKLAKVVFEQQDDHVWGSAERHEIRFLSLRGRCNAPAPTGRQDASLFFFKFQLSADGSGFDCPPSLIQLTGDIGVTEARRGRGEVIFRDSSHDPVADIPVKQVLDSVYTEGHAYYNARTLCEVDPGAFMPFAFAGADAVNTVVEGTLLRAQASRRDSEGRGSWRKTA